MEVLVYCGEGDGYEEKCMSFHYSISLEVHCDGSEERNFSRDWCLAEAQFHGWNVLVKFFLAGWRKARSKTLCPECSNSREIIRSGGLYSNGLSQRKEL